MKILIAENGQHVVESCRYLSKKGHEIFFATPLADSTIKKMFFSKSYSKIIKLNPAENTKEKIKNLNKIYEEYSCDVFYPFGYNLVTEYIEESHKEKKLKMNTPYGKYENYWKLSDKKGLYKLLEETEINLPKLYGEIKFNKKIDLKNLSFPVIVKKTKGVGIKNNVQIATNEKQIQDIIKQSEKLRNKSEEFIVQQYIPGTIYDVGGFSIEGNIYYNVPQRRTITIPLRGGPAAVNDVYNDPKLLELARVIIKKAEWTGPFQVEFRHNPNDGGYYLLEVNAKMWGSTPLSLKANPNLLDIALNTAVGRKVKKSLNFKKNLRYRWICVQELKAIRSGDFTDFLGFLIRFFKNSHYDFDINDPLPDIGRLLGSIKTILLNHDQITKPLVTKKMHERLNPQS